MSCVVPSFPENHPRDSYISKAQRGGGGGASELHQNLEGETERRVIESALQAVHSRVKHSVIRKE